MKGKLALLQSLPRFLFVLIPLFLLHNEAEKQVPSDGYKDAHAYLEVETVERLLEPRMPLHIWFFSLSLSLMANGEEEDEAELEQQLELQLEEQRDSLNALNEALASDPSNSELLSFQEELIVAIRDSEDGLLHLKRSRLLRETDSILSLAAAASGCGFNGNDVKVEALDPQLEAENYGVGSKCRWDWFRYNRYDPHFSENGSGAASGGADLKRLPRGQAEDEDEEEAEEVVAEMEKPCFGVGGDEHRNLESEFGYCVIKNLQFPC